MTFPQFIEALFIDGRLRLTPNLEIDDLALVDARELLCEYEKQDRYQLPSGLPDFDVEVALQAAIMIYRIAILLVHREFDEDAVQHVFAAQPEPQPSPSRHYSVDLAFRFGRDLLKMAVETSLEDPLTKQFTKMLNLWPLSAVGISACDQPQLAPVFQHEGLRRIYVDRIIARQDKRAIEDVGLLKQLQAVAGVYSDLIPWLPAS